MAASAAGFQVAYEVRPSSLGDDVGQGLFAAQFIPRGALIWKYCPGENVRCYRTEADVHARLNELATAADRAFFVSHVYLYDGTVNEILDDGKYWNHSEAPNTGYGAGPNADWQSSYAIRDIHAGEELLDDYGTYAYPDWFVALAQAYGAPQDFIATKEKEAVKPGFHVAYDVRPSPLGGQGLFAAQLIPQHSLIWKYAPGRNVVEYRGAEAVHVHVASLPSPEARRDWLAHVYACDGAVVEILDDGRWWNHSGTPNTGSGVGGDWDSTYALRDIHAGEELLDDYGVYEYPDWLRALFHEHGVPTDFVEIKAPENRNRGGGGGGIGGSSDG